MDDIDDLKPIFNWNDIGNRFLWLGHLLSKLDVTYKDNKAILLKPNYDAHKNEVCEILHWQHQLMRAIASTQPQSYLMRIFFRKHNLPSIMSGDKIRIIAVVLFRQSLMFYCDCIVMNLARIASLERTIDEIVKNRNVVVKLCDSGILEPASIGTDHHFFRLHQGLNSFLLGEEPAPVDKPSKPKEPEPPVPPPEEPSPEPEIPKVNTVSLCDFIKSLPVITPLEMAMAIKQEGYIGQEGAIKSVCLTAWRHINRMKKIYVEQIDEKLLPSKNNTLLLGQTGCGKTFLVELLFSKIIKLPVVISDATKYTESGYVGGDVSHIFTRLIQVAGDDIEKASVGIICLDEFDKLAGCGSAVRFAGEGTNKDLKLGVQQELLKLMEASEVIVPLEFTSSSRAKQIIINTRNIPIIGCGAFSGLWRRLNKRNHSTIGFGFADADNSKTDFKEEIKKVTNFETYGIIPELFGRFSSVVVFDTLTKDELKTILQRNTIRQYEKELALNGLGLQVCPDVYSLIVKQCIERQTGARGLQTTLISHLENALFEAYSNPNSQSVRLFVTGGQIGWEVMKRRVKRIKLEEIGKEMLVTP